MIYATNDVLLWLKIYFMKCTSSDDSLVLMWKDWSHEFFNLQNKIGLGEKLG